VDPVINSSVNMIEWFNKVFIISSFGINPVSGGKPLIDSSRIDIGIIEELGSFCLSQRSLMLLLCVLLNRVNRGRVIVEYRIKYIVDRFGVFVADLLNIHPMWVIDE